MNKTLLFLSLILASLLLVSFASADTMPYWYDEDETGEVWVKVNLTAGSVLNVTLTDVGGYDKDFDAIFPCGDDFDRADNSTVGNGWTEDDAGTWAIDSNRLEYTYNSQANTEIYKSCTASDYTYIYVFETSQTSSNFYPTVWFGSAGQRGGFSSNPDNYAQYIDSTGWTTLGTPSINTKYEFNVSYSSSTGFINYSLASFGTATDKSPHNSGTGNSIRVMAGEQTNTGLVYWIGAVKNNFGNDPTVTCSANTCNIDPGSLDYENVQVKLTPSGLSGDLKVEELEITNATDKTWGLNVNNLYNDSDLSGVTVTFAVGCTNTTDVDGFAQVTNATCSGLSGTLSAVNITKTGWASNATSYTITENGTNNAGMYEGVYSVTSITELITGDTLAASASWSVNTTGGKTYEGNSTDYPANIYLADGLNTLTLQHNDTYYPLSFVVNITAPETTSGAVDGVYNALLNITANTFSGYLSNFTITAENTTLGFSQEETTTSGTARVGVIQNIAYLIEMNAPGYALANVTLTPTDSTDAYEFYLYLMNTFNITIYDEVTNAPITDQNFTVQIISDVFAMNFTYNGSTHEESLLTPSDYEIRYFQAGTNDTYTTPRSYYITLTNQSYNTIRLYAIADAVSGYYIPVVLTESGFYSEGTLVRVYRGYIEGESLTGQVVEMAKSDPNGQVVLRIEPNNIFYKFTGEDGTARFETNYFKITQETHTFQLSDGGLLQSTDLANNNPYNLSFNRLTDTFRLTWEDNSNLITSGCLEISSFSAAEGEQTVYDGCSSGSSGSIAVPLTNTTDKRYLATATITTNTEYSSLTDSLSISFFDDYQIWGLLGVFLTLIVFLFAVNMAQSTEGVVINGAIAILFMSMIGIFAVEWTSIVGVVIVAGIIIYKSRT